MPRSGSVLGASAAGDAERRAHHGSSVLLDHAAVVDSSQHVIDTPTVTLTASP